MSRRCAAIVLALGLGLPVALGGCGDGGAGGEGVPAAGGEESGADTPAAAVETAEGPEGRRGFVESGRAELHYRTMGAGPTVVVVHGGPGLEHSYLLPGMEPLARDFRLVFYDQRGTGRSPAPMDSASITLDRFIADLDRIREEAGVERMTLLGHSWGGLLSILYASRHPERVRALVLMSTIEPGNRYAEETNRRRGLMQTAADSAAVAEIVRSSGFEARDPATVNRLYRLTFRASFADQSRAAELRVEFTERTARALGRLPPLLFGGDRSFDFWDRLPAVTAPTLVVHGAADPIPPAMAREVAAEIPDARFRLLEDAGHFPFVEAPEALFRAIREFLLDGRADRR